MLRIGDFIVCGLIVGAISSLMWPSRSRSFVCWLCKSRTRFVDNINPGTYVANCHYCDLPCKFAVGDDSPDVIQSVQGPFNGTYEDDGLIKM